MSDDRIEECAKQVAHLLEMFGTVAELAKEFETKFTAIEKQQELLANAFDEISNKKIPRISASGLSLRTETPNAGSGEISDVEAAIYDARQLSQSASQETRRLASALECHRFILFKLLEQAPTHMVAGILNETEQYAINFPGKGETLSAQRLSGLELRAFNKELDEVRKLINS